MKKHDYEQNNPDSMTCVCGFPIDDDVHTTSPVNESSVTFTHKPSGNNKLVITHSHLQETPCILCDKSVNESWETKFDKKFNTIAVFYSENTKDYYAVILPKDRVEDDEYGLSDVKDFIRTLLSTARQEERDKLQNKK